MVRQELPLRQGQGITCTRFVVTYADITAGTAPVTINLADALATALQVAAGGLVLGLRIKHDTAFAAPALASLGVTVGVSTGSQTTYFTNGANSYDLMAAVAADTEQFVLAFKAPTNAAFGLTLTFTGDGTYNFNTLTAGQFHIDVFVLQFGPINTMTWPTSVTP